MIIPVLPIAHVYGAVIYIFNTKERRNIGWGAEVLAAQTCNPI